MNPPAQGKILYADSALLHEGWAENVAISISKIGLIEKIDTALASPPENSEHITGALLPGIANCHSHAFQRALLGLTEVQNRENDSFWSWRKVMYEAIEKIGPDELQAIAEQLYIEMLKHGYTGVAEFHYLHHRQNGKLYDDPAEMSHRLIAAAQNAGIHITLLPVLYCYSDFGAKPPLDGQQRFIHSIEGYQNLLDQIHTRYHTDTRVHLGIAPHSLRAVSKALLEEAIICLDSFDKNAPIHIHIAEQEREIEACLAHNGLRPVTWLQDNFLINERWCLIHATHLDKYECGSLAKSKAVTGLCPSTEANLGDGVFPAVDYFDQQGRFAIGSDSQVCVNPAEELRMLEYGQRLIHKQRSILANAHQPSVGGHLFNGAIAGGEQSLGINTGKIARGARADFIVLDTRLPALYGKRGPNLLDSWIFSGHENPVKDVMVSGLWRVKDGNHQRQEAASERFCQVINRLL